MKHPAFRLSVIFLSIGVLVSYFAYYFYAKDRPVSRPDFSPSSSIKVSEESVSIDFASCTPDLKLVDTPIGSTIIEVRGKEFDECVINYDRGGDDATLDQKLMNHCSIPTEKELMSFPIINTEVTFKGIAEFCGK